MQIQTKIKIVKYMSMELVLLVLKELMIMSLKELVVFVICVRITYVYVQDQIRGISTM